MSKLVRALLISVVATGTAAIIVNKIKERSAGKQSSNQKGDGIIDAEQLSPEEISQLTDELNAML